MTEDAVSLQNKIYSLIDLTSLNEGDTETTISLLCERAVLKKTAAVCVLPQWVHYAESRLSGAHIQLAAVANFPQGTDPLKDVLVSIQHAIEQGAREIDLVFPYLQYIAGEQKTACDFVEQCKVLCGKNTLKVILETGALTTAQLIAAASHDVIAAGADFLKTSTGKIGTGATLEAARSMLEVIRLTPNVGIKISGGIRSLAQAQGYCKLAEETLGVDWVTPERFRFGISYLALNGDF